MTSVEDRLQAVEHSVDTLAGELKSWKEQRVDDKRDAIADNERRHRTVLGAISDLTSEFKRLNGSVRENRERILVMETHQQRSKEDKHRRLLDERNANAQASVRGRDLDGDGIMDRIPPPVRWSAGGGIVLFGIVELLQRLAEIVSELLSRVPVIPT